MGAKVTEIILISKCLTTIYPDTFDRTPSFSFAQCWHLPGWATPKKSWPPLKFMARGGVKKVGAVDGVQW